MGFQNYFFKTRMKRILPLLAVLIFSGCNLFENEKVSSEEIYSLESKQLNWHEVDQYPAFLECKDLIEAEAAKTCFEEKVVDYVYARLEEKQPVVTQELNDTLWLHLIVSEKGVPAIDTVEMDSVVVNQLPKIKLWLQESIDSLPKIVPANKRGIPVATKFKLPIVIKAE